MDKAGNGESSRTVLLRIRSALPTLRPSERTVAEAVLADPAHVAEMPIGELAEKCGTSTTSVVRFYKKIGYNGYSDLRLDLARESTRESLVNNIPAELYEDIDRADSIQDVVAKIAINETASIADTAQALDIEKLMEAITAISAAKRIDVFGIGAAALVARDFQQKLHRIGKIAFSWSDADAAWTSAALTDSNNVSVAISHSGTTFDTVEFVKIAKENGATTVAVTNHPDSPLGRAADIVLSTAARESPFRPGAMGSRIAQMMLIDCLFVGIAQRSYEGSITALRKTRAAVQVRRMHPDSP
ncbi:MurR/RpiR family transcriptional regulator [Arthrobacter sp. B2a2-09]|uniref:MurR/RpiR family transcriptional regulator n=1 Tax=Arthrobacter sp. B2a2-09 TaxID=2952822 RepID=UPI0022CD8ECB|nr:MurR/RpiR family transcriptional regulator [Arthrobacter sp. B2a2-09]MCZ9883241.1 MurR/RpiR family transcriptional regulator [Arthrobacter sp. B2a2-09]